MTVGSGFRRLTRVIRRLERDGWTVEDVIPESGEGLRKGETLSVVLECQKVPDVPIETTNGEHPSALSQLDWSSDMAEIETHELIARPNGHIQATLRVRITVPGRESETDSQPEESRTPLHRDSPRLRRLYARHSSFAEIAEAVEEDVSAETIRRYTIEHDIHNPGGPGPRDVTSPEEDDTPPVLADGHGLPHGIKLESLVSTIEGANTLYDVQRDLELDRQEATELLNRFNLLELVVGRIGTAPDREVARETIEQRLRNGH